MTKEELKEVLPHREPMLLLDEATKIEDNLERVSIRCAAMNGFCKGTFQGTQWFQGSFNAR